MKISLKEASDNLGLNPSRLFIKLFEHGSMSVEYYKPETIDLQTPHKQDELYIITSGSGEFIHEAERCNFKSGDLLFVPAGDVHRFENYTSDFATWVIFFGKEGGELRTWG
jgi:mannose-6-phosphate isomerase-like protein (cupin superfamily)